MHQLYTLAHPLMAVQSPRLRLNEEKSGTRNQVEREVWTGFPRKKHRGYELETSGHDTAQTSSYVAVVAYGQSFLALRKKSPNLASTLWLPP